MLQTPNCQIPLIDNGEILFGTFDKATVDVMQGGLTQGDAASIHWHPDDRQLLAFPQRL